MKKKQSFSIGCHGDALNSNCLINTCTVLPTGDFVLCDRLDKSLKLFDNEYSYRSMIKVPPYPFHSCLSGVDITEVWVTVPDSKSVQRIKINAHVMTKNKEIKLKDKCCGVTCCEVGIAIIMGEVLTKRYIQLLDYDGTLLKQLQLPKLRLDNYITSIMEGKQLVIFELVSSRLLSIDIVTGETVFSVSICEDWDYRNNVTTDSERNIYVLNSVKNTIFAMSYDGKKNCVMLNEKDGLSSPRGLAYNPRDDALLLQPKEDTSEMCVYSLIK